MSSVGSLLGRPLPRQDGPAKVTGVARYAGDHRADGMLHGVLVGAPVPAGRLRAVQTAAAQDVPGVVRVLTHRDFPRLRPGPVPPCFSDRMPLQDDEVRHQGEPIALVLAESLHAAELAAALVRAEVEPGDFVPHPGAARDGAAVPRESGYLFMGWTEFEHGDIEQGLAEAVTGVRETYVQPSRHHNPMEPSATLAEWEGDRLTVVDSTQWVYGVRLVLAAALDVPRIGSASAPRTSGVASVVRDSCGPIRSSPQPRHVPWAVRCGSCSPALTCTTSSPTSPSSSRPWVWAPTRPGG